MYERLSAYLSFPRKSGSQSSRTNTPPPLDGRAGAATRFTRPAVRTATTQMGVLRHMQVLRGQFTLPESRVVRQASSGGATGLQEQDSPLRRPGTSFFTVASVSASSGFLSVRQRSMLGIAVRFPRIACEVQADATAEQAPNSSFHLTAARVRVSMAWSLGGRRQVNSMFGDGGRCG